MTLATTVWVPQTGNGEYVVGTPAYIVDENANYLVDPTDSAIYIVDTGAVYSPVPTTVWQMNEGS